jgi:glyoxylase-like metal-dependent hydrolase (beta-lactamase superfamily II)
MKYFENKKGHLIMRITNNIYNLSGSCFSVVNNYDTLGEVYGIKTQQGIILIDCGKPRTGLAMLKETLLYFDVNEQITHLIVTHAHHDHCGNAKELQEAGAKVIVGAGDVNYCKNGGFWGMGNPFEKEQAYPAFEPDIIIDNDSKMKLNNVEFEFILIPGHSPGSMAIRIKLDGKIILFTGDTLEPGGTYLENYLFGWPGDPLFDKKKTVESLLKLTKYEADMILPGHGKICLKNGSELLRCAAQSAFITLR